MNEEQKKYFRTELAEIPADNVIRFVLSSPQKNSQWKKVTAKRLADGSFQVEKLTEKQAFHEKLATDKKLWENEIFELFGSIFSQIDIFDNDFSYSFRAAKKRVLFNRRKSQKTAAVIPLKQDREKNYILNEGMNIRALVDLGVFHSDFTLIKKSSAKFKQINRFVEFVDDMLKKSAPAVDRPFTVVDFGCGKSYLTFILHYYFTEILKWNVRMIGMDLKKEVIEDCSKIAEKYGCKGLSFQYGDIGSYDSKDPVDMVVTLHACDTATDHALYHAIRKNVKYILSVPCCQHELNSQFSSRNFKVFEDYGLIQERFCTLLTDTIRAELLKSCNYNVQLMEFVDLSHTPKNIMIRAEMRTKKITDASKHLENISSLVEEFNLSPTLVKLLAD